MVLGPTLLKGTFFWLVKFRLNQPQQKLCREKGGSGFPRPFSFILTVFVDEDLYVYTMCKHIDYTKPYPLGTSWGSGRPEGSDLTWRDTLDKSGVLSDVNCPELI